MSACVPLSLKIKIMLIKIHRVSRTKSKCLISLMIIKINIIVITNLAMLRRVRCHAVIINNYCNTWSMAFIFFPSRQCLRAHLIFGAKLKFKNKKIERAMQWIFIDTAKNVFSPLIQLCRISFASVFFEMFVAKVIFSLNSLACTREWVIFVWYPCI